jgi:hypothetical protein
VGTKRSPNQHNKSILRAQKLYPYPAKHKPAEEKVTSILILRILQILVLCLILGLLAGCSDLAYSIKGFQPDDIIPDSWWEIEGQIEQEELCRVKYHDLYNKNFYMVVEGQMGQSPKKYPVILDTGASRSVILEQSHVSAHKLPVYTQRNDIINSNGNSFGLCYLPELNIGQTTLTNLPGMYLKQKASFNPFELFIPREKVVIVGLQALMKFKYIAFDNPEKQVELSNNDSFEPQEPDLWAQYSFEIEQDLGGNAFLYVKLPIAGRQITLQLDTGSGRGLAVKKDLWEKMPGRIKNVKLAGGRDFYPYIGKLACKRGVIPQVEIGEVSVHNAKVSVFPDDSPLVEDCEGLLGMQCFQQTIIVLDFERNLMWVKNTTTQS